MYGFVIFKYISDILIFFTFVEMWYFKNNILIRFSLDFHGTFEVILRTDYHLFNAWQTLFLYFEFILMTVNVVILFSFFEFLKILKEPTLFDWISWFVVDCIIVIVWHLAYFFSETNSSDFGF